VDEEGELIIWGYDAFEVYEAREDGLPDYEGGLVTHDFLRTLAGYLEPNEELDIQTAGFTKCRFPVLAKRYVVRDGEILHADLSSPSRSTSSVVRPQEGCEAIQHKHRLMR